MSAKFITGVLTTAALITGLIAAPARAENNQAFEGVLFGAATIFMLSKIFDQINDDNHRPKSKAYVPSTRSDHRPPRRKRSLIPPHCVRAVSVGNREYRRRVVTSRCLHQTYRGARRLPASCQTAYRNRGYKRQAYDLRCLHQHGFRVAGRR